MAKADSAATKAALPQGFERFKSVLSIPGFQNPPDGLASARF
jgi:hypothetical protein